VLSPREREIAARLLMAKTSKMIAREIDLSPKAMEMYRAQRMKKFSAATSSELVHKLAWGSMWSDEGVKKPA
jgi:FixJ family two-component response regulator